MAIESPGSFNEFGAAHPEIEDQKELVTLYFEGLSAYRASLAEDQGVTLAQLHNPNERPNLVIVPESEATTAA